MHDLDPNLRELLHGCKAEPSLGDTPAGAVVQCERLGYFAPDIESKPDALVFNRTISLKDGWAKTQRKG